MNIFQDTQRQAEKLYIYIYIFFSQVEVQFSTNQLVWQRRSEPDFCTSLPLTNSSRQRWPSVLYAFCCYYSCRIIHLIVFCMSSAEIMEAAVFCAIQGHRETVRVEVFQVRRQKRWATRRDRFITVCPCKHTRAPFLMRRRSACIFVHVFYVTLTAKRYN